jgi:hypothetical protein
MTDLQAGLDKQLPDLRKRLFQRNLLGQREQLVDQVIVALLNVQVVYLSQEENLRTECLGCLALPVEK